MSWKKLLVSALLLAVSACGIADAQAGTKRADKFKADVLYLCKEQASDPSTPGTGTAGLYCKTDGRWYLIDDTGSVFKLGDTIRDADNDTRIWVEKNPDEDIIRFDVATAEVAQFKAAEIVFNEAGANRDFRVESDTKPQMFFLDASENRIYFGEKGSSSGRGQVVSVTDSIADPDFAQFTADTPGNAQGERSTISFLSTFEGSVDSGPRRTADILAGFNSGTWGNEYLAFHVGNNGSGNDSGNLTDEKARITQDGMVIGGTDLTPDGPLHIGAGLAGSVTASANADEVIIESDQSTFGLTLLGSNTSDQRIHFGRTSDNDAGIISFNQTGQFMELYVQSTAGRNLRLAGNHSIFNPDGVDLDFQIEGDTNVNLFYLNAGTDNIGLGSATPDASALLDLVSTSKGLGFPSMTGTQRDAISTPRDGLTVHNTTTDTIDARLNGSWLSLETTAGTGQIECQTVQASTSGTAIDFTSLVAAAKRVLVIFDAVSLDGTDRLLVQIGDSGGLETSGYDSSSSAGTSVDISASGFIVRSNTASHTHSGIMEIVRITGNDWVSSHTLRRGAGVLDILGGGDKTLSGDLDRVRVTRTGTDNFDAGQINVCTEL